MRILVSMAAVLLVLSSCGGLQSFTDSGTSENPTGECGDGNRQAGEECDGTDFGGESCASFGHTAGLLSCDVDCEINDNNCIDERVVPARWTCADELYSSGGGCDCGCGEVDPDCSNSMASECDTCSAPGSCGTISTCPGDIDATNNATCASAQCGDDVVTPPELCDGLFVGGETCESQGFAGGGLLQCNDSCDGYDTSECTSGGSGVPAGWTCNTSYYNASDGCDCGCGEIDPDCTDSSSASCDYCTNTGSCAGSCNDIQSGDNSTCIASGTCGNNLIELGEACDGTELAGNDCTSIAGGFTGGTLTCDPSSCEFDDSQCTGSTTAAPSSWACDELWWSDGACDCGCGAFDVNDCADMTVGSCDYCDDFGSCALVCDDIDPVDNATCGGGGTGGTAPTSAGDILITEIMPDPSTLSDSAGEWFEVHNPGSSDLELTGCEFRSDPSNVLVASAVTVPAGGYATWAAGSAPGFTSDGTFSTGSFSMRNSNDTWELWCGGTKIDSIAYDKSAGWPLVPGKSMQLDLSSFNHTSNDQGSAWCQGTASYNGDFGTPGAANSGCP